MSKIARAVPPGSLCTRLIPPFLAGFGALVLCAALSLALGSRPVPLSTVAEALFGDAHGRDALVVTGLRPPRTFFALAVGVALGVAGAVAQGITRDPLASPTALGINAGAGCAVVVALYALHLARPVEYLWFAFFGAAAAGVLAQMPARRAGDLDPVRLALGGVVLQVVLLSWTQPVMPVGERTLAEARFWPAGSLSWRTLDVLWPVLPTLVIGLVLALAISPALNTPALGGGSAQAFGVPVAGIRVAGGVAVVWLAGSAVAVAGPVAFIGPERRHVQPRPEGPDGRHERQGLHGPGRDMDVGQRGPGRGARP